MMAGARLRRCRSGLPPDRGLSSFQAAYASRRAAGWDNPRSAVSTRVSASAGIFRARDDRGKNIFVRAVFTPCTLGDSLLEAITEAARNATAGAVIFVSPACSRVGRSQNHQQRREGICRRVKSISRGRQAANPHMNGRNSGNLKQNRSSRRNCVISFRGFLRENHGANIPTTHLTERTPSRQIQ